MTNEGRVAIYTPELGEIFCRVVAEGATVKEAAERIEISAASIHQWVHRHPEFRDAYQLAKEIRLELWVDQMLEIAAERDDDDVQSRRLEIQTRQWIMSRLAPKQYGDKLDVAHAGNVVVRLANFDDGK